MHGSAAGYRARFNPRPALAGRASFHDAVRWRASKVSILARPSRAGRPGRSAQAEHVQNVSILARPSRAGRHPTLRGVPSIRPVSILARPSRAGRPASRPCAVHRCAVSILARPPAPAWHWWRRFNPRPALAGRASDVGLAQAGGDGVSILARPSRAGRHCSTCAPSLVTMFQSSPGPRWPGVS